MDNRSYILPLLDFTDPDKFYFIQIFKRRKDNPDMDKDMVVLRNFTVFTLEEFHTSFEKIRKICTDNNARAYIRLNRRSEKKVALQMLARLATMIAMEQYNVENVYWSATGEFHSETDKTWLIDIDTVDFIGKEAELASIHERIKELQILAGREPRMHIIPTKNGYHIITRPFNKKMLEPYTHGKGVKIDIHTDNPTILYTL